MGHVPMLYEELTPSENLRFFARLYDVEDGAKRADELLRAVGLWTRRDEPTAVLSRGMHQRLALARAVLLIEELDGLEEVRTLDDAIVVYIADGSRAIARLVTLVQEAGLDVREVTLAQPTLDDVFLRTTGRHLEVDAEVTVTGEGNA